MNIKTKIIMVVCMVAALTIGIFTTAYILQAIGASPIVLELGSKLVGTIAFLATYFSFKDAVAKRKRNG